MPQKLRSIMGKTLSIGLICLILIIIAVLTLWFLCRPKGELVLAVAEGIGQHKSRISQHYQTAVTRTQHILDYHRKLSLEFDTELVQNFVPGQRLEETFRPSKFNDFVKLELMFDFGEEPLKFSGQFKLGRIAEFMYDVFELCDFYLVVMDYEEISSRRSEPPVTMGTLVSAEKLAKMIARLHPLDGTGKEIPRQGPGSKDELQNELAFYIYECFWLSALDTLEKDVRKNVLPLRELSHNIQSLEHTITGFEILEQGTAHSLCTELSSEDCVKQARKEFESALRYDPENAHACFGLGIVSLRQAVDAKRDNASAYTIGTFLVEAGNYIYVARTRSEFLRNLTESQEWHTILRQWPEYKNLSITNKFIDTIYNYREASEEFAKANYANALNLVTKVEDIPPDFSGLLKSFEYEAKLYLAKTQHEAEQLLKEFKKWSEAIQGDPGWRQSYAFHACRHGIGFEDAMLWLDRSIDEAPDFTSQCDSYALKGQCLAMVGRYDEARKIAMLILRDLGKRPYSEEFMGVYLDLGYLFALLKDYESAADYFIKAAKFWKRYIDNVRNAPDLQDFRTNGQAAFRRFNNTMLEYYREKNGTTKY